MNHTRIFPEELIINFYSKQFFFIQVFFIQKLTEVPMNEKTRIT